jgi:hypothetical protein
MEKFTDEETNVEIVTKGRDYQMNIFLEAYKFLAELKYKGFARFYENPYKF